MSLSATASISPCLWFDHELEEAAEFYTSIFPHSQVGHMTRYTESGPGEPGTVMAGDFTLDGLTFRGINGGPEHAGFTETISFSSPVPTRRRSTTTGPRSPRAAARSPSAAGSRTGSGCRGRSCRSASTS